MVVQHTPSGLCPEMCMNIGSKEYQCKLAALHQVLLAEQVQDSPILTFLNELLVQVKKISGGTVAFTSGLRSFSKRLL